MIFSTAPSGRSAARRSLRIGTALGGAMAAAMFATPAAAQQCGAPVNGTVTCTTAGNPYSTGVTYTVATPTTVVLNDGVAIRTTAANTPGVSVNGGAAVAVQGGAASIVTTGNNSTGFNVTSTGGPINVAIGSVSTSGELAGGVRADGALNQNVNVSTGDVTTNGVTGPSFSFLPSSTAVFARAAGTGATTVRTGNLSTRGVGASGVAASGGGNVTVTTGTVSTLGAGANGVSASSANGLASVTTGNITTAGDNANGVLANGAGTVVTTGNVTTSGSGSAGISASSNGGGTTVAFGSIVTGGTLATGVNASDSGASGVTVRGTNVTTTGQASPAISARSGGTGGVLVATTGTVTASGRGGLGIEALSTGGGVNVSAVNVTSVAANAADVSSARGAIFAQGVNAVVTSTGTLTSSSAADTVSANATAGDAAVTVNAVNAGTTGVAGGRAVVVTASRDATATINGAVRSNGTGSNAVVVTGGRNASVTLGSGSGITGGSDGLVVTSGTSGVTTITNNGTVGANANGFAIRAAGGAATINNAGTLNGDLQLTGGADTINNSGTFLVGPNPDFGAGNDLFANTGVVRLVPGATAAVTGATFTGLERFTNAGTIDLRNGIVGDVLTIPGTYTGSGAATLGVDVAQGATSGTSDRLVIGGAATGTTVVALNQIGTGFPAFNAGTTIVQAGAGSSAAAFDLAGGFQNQGLVRYEVVFNAANNSFQLVGGPSDAAFSTLNYLEGVRNLWLKSADVVSAQLRSRRDALWAFGGGDPAGRMWLQIHGSVDTRERGDDFTAFGQTRFVENGFEQDYFGGQLGFDFTGGVGDRGGFAFGVTGGYINSDLSFSGGPDRIGFDVINGGVYGSFSSGNIFANVLGKYDYFWADANSQRAGFQVDEKGGVYGARGEVGIRFGSDSFFIEPAASVSWTKSDFDDFTSLGTQIQFRDDDGLRGRFGGRIGGQFAAGGAIVAGYLGGNYVHEFMGEDEVSLISGGQTLTFANSQIRDYGEGVLGMTIGQSEGISGFLEGTYSRSFNRRAGLLDQEGAGGRAGLRLRF